LALLAKHRDSVVTSEKIARSAGTNPAFIRRVLIDLSKAGLTKSQLGKGGGAMLAKGPKKISLLEIYRAVETGQLIAQPKPTRQGSPIAEAISPVLCELADQAEAAFYKSLEGVSLKEVLKQMKLKAA